MISAWLAMTALGQASLPRLTLITETPLPAEAQKAFFAGDRAEIKGQYEKLGYLKVPVEGVEMLASKEVWREAQYSTILSSLKAISKNIGADGTFQLGRDQTLDRFARIGFSAMGLNLSSSGRIGVAAELVTSFTDGTKRITLEAGQDINPEGAKKLESAPMQLRTREQGFPSAEELDSINPRMLLSVSALSRGRDSNNPVARANDLEAFAKANAEMVGRYLREIDAAKQAVLQALPERLAATDLQVGAKLGDQPNGAGATLAKRITDNWEQLGFKSSDEAAEYARRATLTGCRDRLFVVGSKRERDGSSTYVMYGIQ